MDDDQRENFERAFSTGMSSCRSTCACGKEFYDNVNSYDWGDGEFEELSADPEAVALDHPVGGVTVNGREYCGDCTCWHETAEKMIRWLEANQEEVAAWYSLERQRLADIAAKVPVIRVNPTFKPGDVVVALTEIRDDPTGDHPGFVYAKKGQKLIIIKAGGPLDYVACPPSDKGLQVSVRNEEIYPDTSNA